MRTIIISDSEQHPIPAGAIPGDKKKGVLIFGLAMIRGRNMVYSTRLTDKFYDVIRAYGMTVYVEEPNNKCDPRESVAVAKQDGLELEMIGVSYNVRKTMKPERYKRFVQDLALSLDEEEGGGKTLEELNIAVRERSERPPSSEDPAATKIDGVTSNETPPNGNQEPPLAPTTA